MPPYQIKSRKGELGNRGIGLGLRLLRFARDDGWTVKLLDGKGIPAPSTAFRMTKKIAFLTVFLLTLFDITLKYSLVCLLANINRQQAKMTFQLACRKRLSHKDLQPAGPVS